MIFHAGAKPKKTDSNATNNVKRSLTPPLRTTQLIQPKLQQLNIKLDMNGVHFLTVEVFCFYFILFRTWLQLGTAPYGRIHTHALRSL